MPSVPTNLPFPQPKFVVFYDKLEIAAGSARALHLAAPLVSTPMSPFYLRTRPFIICSKYAKAVYYRNNYEHLYLKKFCDYLQI